MTHEGFDFALMQEGGTSSRRAALLLHGLDAPDRAWLLEQLDVAERAVLARLLAELTALGVPSNAMRAGPATPVVPTTEPRPAPMSATPISAAAERIMCTPMADIVDLLRREPDALIARVMPHLHPAWARRFLAHLDPARRGRIVARSTDDAGRSPAGALDLAILQSICSRTGRRTVRSGVRDGVEAARKSIVRGLQGLRRASRARSEVAP